MQGVASLSPVQLSSGNRVAARRFSVAPSPLTQAAKNDPVADSIELSRHLPYMLSGQATYSPPPQQVLASGGAESRLRGGNPENGESENGTQETDAANGSDAERDAAADGETNVRGEPLDESEKDQVRLLKTRDQEVRTHEQAHKAVGGSYAGGVSYEYQQGPDGQRYAVGGEVSIDVSAERTPEATIAKMRQVKAAAMAPANPSGQDRSVAAQATQSEAQARQELQQMRAGGSETARGEGEEGREKAESENRIGGKTAGTQADGGSTTLSSNPYLNAYLGKSESPQTGMRQDSANAPSGYRPINIVA